MKAWLVGDPGEMGWYLVHAPTPGKAKSIAIRHTDIALYDEWHEFTYLKVLRCKVLDDKPFTVENAATVLQLPDEADCPEDRCSYQQYKNQCPCELCKEVKE